MDYARKKHKYSNDSEGVDLFDGRQKNWDGKGWEDKTFMTG